MYDRSGCDYAAPDDGFIREVDARIFVTQKARSDHNNFEVGHDIHAWRAVLEVQMYL
jgi:hypothetical protein